VRRCFQRGRNCHIYWRHHHLPHHPSVSVEGSTYLFTDERRVELQDFRDNVPYRRRNHHTGRDGQGFCRTNSGADMTGLPPAYERRRWYRRYQERLVADRQTLNVPPAWVPFMNKPSVGGCELLARQPPAHLPAPAHPFLAFSTYLCDRPPMFRAYRTLGGVRSNFSGRTSALPPGRWVGSGHFSVTTTVRTVGMLLGKIPPLPETDSPASGWTFAFSVISRTRLNS